MSALMAMVLAGEVRMGQAAQPLGDAHPQVETEPVGSDSDAADDAAIWRHPTNPALSLVVGTDKRGGAVEVYDLAGVRLQRISGARANGVDLRMGVSLADAAVDLVAVGGDELRLFRVDADARRLVPVAIGKDGSRVNPNGLCLYRSTVSGRLYVFGISLQSEVDQLEIVANGDKLDLVPVRQVWDVGHDSEACVADDDLGHVYINEADVALWKYGAEPGEATSASNRRAVDRVGGRGHLVADVEGVTLVHQPGGTGYLIASSQGEDAFTVYRRDGDNAYVRKFRVEQGNGVDGCSNTDGIDALAADLGPTFPSGIFVCQDHHNSSPDAGRQNFKYVRLEDVVDVSENPPAAAGPAAPDPATDPETADAPPGATFPGPAASSPSGSAGPNGYWMVGAGGSVYAFGDAAHLGTPAGRLAPGVVALDLESTPSGRGYWILDSSGGVYAFGDAVDHGDLGWVELQAGEAATSLSTTPSGSGYWIFTTRGRVIRFGDAGSHGDLSQVPLNGPVLDSVATPSGQGYYMVAADGGVFAFGDAHFTGSMGGMRLNAPVQSLVPDGDGAGYWLVAADGGVFAFDAPFRGSMGSYRLNRPVTGMVRFGNGYLMVAADGGVFNFSHRPFLGSLGDRPPPHPVVAVAALP